MHFTVEKLERRINELAGLRYRDHQPLDTLRIITEDVSYEEALKKAADSPAVRVGDRWGGRDVYAWFAAELDFPAAWNGQDVIGLIKLGETGGGNCSGYEAQVYWNGEALQALDRNHGELFVPAASVQQGSAQLAIRAWSGLTAPNGDHVPFDHRVDRLEFAVLDEAVDDLYYTALHMLQTVKVLDDRVLEKQAMVAALEQAFAVIDWSVRGAESFYRSAAEARELLHAGLKAIPRGPRPQITAVGHCHIDVAWLWRLKHTREKSGRSFSTVLQLMDRFPEYVFIQSQPQLYSYLKKDFPELYARIKQKVQEGRWEADGGMWLEADCNIPSGESLVRQLLAGKRFFREEFGVDNKVLWLPDVFGYSWALPQILKKSGIDYFMTTKISWSQYNRFPYDTFTWRGMDGTEILTHFITTPDSDGSWYYTYNGNVTGSSVQGLWDNYRQKDINDKLLLAYGWGDGGGGPTRDMIEAVRRYEDMPAAPQVKPGGAESFFKTLEENVRDKERLHLWDGELYLEYHRGTYTSQAYNKRMNRRMEQLLHQAEFVNTLALILNPAHSYPASSLGEVWETVLRNQFHDIIPGSSIREVYEDSRKEYEAAELEAVQLILDGVQGLEKLEKAAGGRMEGPIAEEEMAAGDPTGGPERGPAAVELTDEDHPGGKRRAFRVFNGLGWQRSFLAGLAPEGAGAEACGEWSWYTAEGERLESQVQAGIPDTVLVSVKDVPAYGYTTIYGQRTEPAGANTDAAGKSASECNPDTGSADWHISESELETPFYSIRLNPEGQIVSLIDKRVNREVLKPGQPANVLQVFEDKPMNFDAWDIDIFYQEKMRVVNDVQEIKVLEEGPLRGVVSFKYHYLNSVISQKIIVYRDHPRIDFVTEADWQEHQQLLKVAFPVEIRSTKATYEVQFGNVERPTHWNTSWDYARFESAAQRWADLSEGGYGVSLLNDCKYGHDIRGHVIRLSLIKSAVWPDGSADQGHHAFTYSLLPHNGGWFEGGTHAAACELNAPLMTVPAEEGVQEQGGLPAELGMLRISAPNIMIDTVKKAEDSQSVIVRMYEYAGMRLKAPLELGAGLGSILAAEETNLMEEQPMPLGVSGAGNTIELDFKPYEIKTVRITLEQ
ncbi:alpha-mannosidase [Paenibacillus pinistramenti]|uniref:alpha-mannosidase n=1 Tax=Paenibacillus pinistramenti TaxID=1768003 RepID=UPI00110923B9|nr:alpha-mannosidase [Paenibacillus pinistramenti]